MANDPMLHTTTRFVVPQVVATHFHIRPGDVVADFGAGSGYFIPILAELVGSEGRVYACEIQKNLVEKIGDLARARGWTQVQPLWSDIDDPGGSKIPDNTVDVGIMVNTFFQLDDRAEALREVQRALRPGAKFFLIDWNESYGGLGPAPGAVVSATTAEQECEAAGFVYERAFPAGLHHYGLAFRAV